jgi:two-component system cell cycle sensor histidine kinase/response regulator CckA
MVAEREAGVGRRGLGAALGALIGQRARPASGDPALPFAALAAGFSEAPFGVYGADRQGRLRWANAAFAEMLGVPVERLVADAPPLASFIAVPPPAGRPPYDLVGSDADQAAAEIELRRDDGSPLRVFVSQEVRRDRDGLHVRGIVEQRHRIRDVEAALQLSEQRFRRFVEEAPLGIVLLDRAGRIEQCNRAFRVMTRGALPAIAEGCALDELIHPDDRAAANEQLARAASDPEPPPALDVQLAGATGRVAILSMSRRDDAGGHPTGVRAFLVDATEQKRLELQFAHSQKIQAVGQLAGGIAHDFNNLLTAMIGFCDLLLLRHRPGDQSFADIMQIKQNANRAANLVRQLLAFSRQQTLQPRVLNLADVLGELSHLLRRLIGENIDLAIVHGRDLSPVKVDHGQIEQVIINLAVNARDAMPNGGKLTIRTSNVTIERPVTRGGETMPPGHYVVIEVTDTGTGIPPEIQGRIFDPFFSTKEVGQGVGLGLSTVYGILKQTGGFVFVDSQPGQGGAAFSIYLPRHDGGTLSEPARDSGDGSALDLTGIGTILLVEDEDAVRLFGARALRNKGYQVLEARDGEAALEIVDGEGGGIDLLVTDVVMPRMDGPTLAREIRARRPDMKVIFISGYAEDDFRRRLDEDADIHFLAKPFSLKQLAGKVKDALRDSDRG